MRRKWFIGRWLFGLGFVIGPPFSLLAAPNSPWALFQSSQTASVQGLSENASQTNISQLPDHSKNNLRAAQIQGAGAWGAIQSLPAIQKSGLKIRGTVLAPFTEPDKDGKMAPKPGILPTPPFETDTVERRGDPRAGRLTHFRMKPGVQVDPENFFGNYQGKNGLGLRIVKDTQGQWIDEIQKIGARSLPASDFKDGVEREITRYRQDYLGLKVVGAGAFLISKGGMVERGGLNFVEGLNLSTTPKISESEATAIAKQSVEGKSPLMNNAAKSSIGSQSLPLLNRSSASLTVQEDKIEPVAEPIPGEELELTTKSLTFNLDQSAGPLVKMGNPDLGKLKMISTELVVFCKNFDFRPEQCRLAYLLRPDSEDPLKTFDVYVDANDGMVLAKINQVKPDVDRTFHKNVSAKGYYILGGPDEEEGYFYLIADQDTDGMLSLKCQRGLLQNPPAKKFELPWNLSFAKECFVDTFIVDDRRPNPQAVSGEDPDRDYLFHDNDKDGKFAEVDEVSSEKQDDFGVSAYYALGYNLYWLSRWQWLGFDGLGKIPVTVFLRKVQSKYVAGYYGNDEIVIDLEKGCANGSPLYHFCHWRLLGHELTHGILDHSVGLAYYGESAYLHEGISEALAVLLHSYSFDLLGGEFNPFDSHPEKSDPLVVGGPKYLGQEGCSSEKFCYQDPKLGMVDCNPEDENSTNYCDQEHRNGAPVIQLVKLLKQGGKGTNEIGQKYQVNGLGKEHSGLLFFRTVTSAISSTAGYQELCNALVSMEEDPANKIDVQNACHAIGVLPAYDPRYFSPSDFSTIHHSQFKIEVQVFEDAEEAWELEYRDLKTGKVAQAELLEIHDEIENSSGTKRIASFKVQLFPGRSYSWSYRYKMKGLPGPDPQGEMSAWVSHSFKTQTQKVQLISPNPGQVLVAPDKFLLSWSGVSGAAGYEVQLSKDPNCFSLKSPAACLIKLGSDPVGEGSTQLEPSLPYNGDKYYWRVSARFTGIESDEWSDIGQFQLMPEKKNVVLLKPADGAGEVDYNKPVMEWQLPEGGPGTSSPGGFIDFGSSLVQEMPAGVSDPQTLALASGTIAAGHSIYQGICQDHHCYTTAPTLKPGTTYYWQAFSDQRVKNENLLQNSVLKEVSLVGTFKTKSLAPKEDQKNTLAILAPTEGSLAAHEGPVISWQYDGTFGSSYAVAVSALGTSPIWGAVVPPNSDPSLGYVRVEGLGQKSLAWGKLTPGAGYTLSVYVLDENFKQSGQYPAAFVNFKASTQAQKEPPPPASDACNPKPPLLTQAPGNVSANPILTTEPAEGGSQLWVVPNQFYLSWSPVPNATKYRVYLQKMAQKNPNFGNIYPDTKPMVTCDVSIPQAYAPSCFPLEKGGRYIGSVRPLDKCGQEGPATLAFGFMIDTGN